MSPEARPKVSKEEQIAVLEDEIKTLLNPGMEQIKRKEGASAAEVWGFVVKSQKIDGRHTQRVYPIVELKGLPGFEREHRVLSRENFMVARPAFLDETRVYKGLHGEVEVCSETAWVIWGDNARRIEKFCAISELSARNGRLLWTTHPGIKKFLIRRDFRGILTSPDVFNPKIVTETVEGENVSVMERMLAVYDKLAVAQALLSGLRNAEALR